ncbi:MAG: glycosyltransferase family 2 protein [Verrucomicrobiia bacterium]|jgi:glycosyltransferase involved in cell wall biosynthesis
MKTLVAVIAYNEEQNIRATLADLQAHNCGFDIVAIDNGSSDATTRLCREMGVPVVAHCINTGGSMGTVTSYFNYAHRRGYDCLCQFDGDGQHIAAELPKIIEPVRRGEADYVIGSRFLTGEGFQSTAVRRLGIRLFAWMDSQIMGRKVMDVTSGLRAYSRRVIEFFGHSYRGELHDTNQLLLVSHFTGARVLEVAVQMRLREHGASEYDFINAVAYPFLGAVNILGVWLQKQRIQKMR